MFEKFTSELKDAFKYPLPGKTAHELLKPYLKVSKRLDAPQILKPRVGAVMALIYPVEHIPHILLIERPIYDGVHSGQIAFPGGKVEKSDASHLATALRETEEEVGIAINDIEVVGPLTEVYVLASNFMVYPFVGILNNPPKLSLRQNEVADTLHIPLNKFFENGILREKPIRNTLGFTLMAPYYDLNGKVLWGATAMMVSELCSIIQGNKIRV
jgi:8-oxo-dGTP pyrophosphatase MutT (NUDIX family)